MASKIISQQLILWDGYNLTTKLKSTILSHDQNPVDETTLGLTTHSNALGLKTVAFQVEGKFDDVDYDAALATSMARSNFLITAADASAVGSTAYFFQAMQGNYDPIKGSVGELASFSAGGVAQESPLVRGVILSNDSALSATGSGTPYQLGAVGATQRLYAGLHILAINNSSGDTIDMVIESDALVGFGSPATQITFTQMTNIGSQFKSVAGAITDTFYRPTYVISGSTPSFAAVVTLGIL